MTDTRRWCRPQEETAAMAITTRIRKKKQYRKAVLKLRAAIKRGDAEAIRIRREQLQAMPKPRLRYAREAQA
jgi:hypothetical protein